MVSNDIIRMIEQPETLNFETLYRLRILISQYPYFQSARILYLNNLFLLHDSSFGLELKKNTIFLNDRRKLYYTLDGSSNLALSKSNVSDEIVHREENDVADRTLLLIDSFLSKFPDNTQNQADLSFDSNDYFEIGNEALKSDLEVKPSAGLSMKIADSANDENQIHHIKNIVSVADENEKATDNPEPDASYESELDESYFTETLAKIYIKQRRYEKALEIIRKLSLKYPKKNAYFADQIRFLEKLIINEKSK